jgi:hypothetical protein
MQFICPLKNQTTPSENAAIIPIQSPATKNTKDFHLDEEAKVAVESERAVADVLMINYWLK